MGFFRESKGSPPKFFRVSKVSPIYLQESKEYLIVSEVYIYVYIYSHGNPRVSPEAMPRFCQEDFQASLRGCEGILPGKILYFNRQYIFASSILDWPMLVYKRPKKSLN